MWLSKFALFLGLSFCLSPATSWSQPLRNTSVLFSKKGTSRERGTTTLFSSKIETPVASKNAEKKVTSSPESNLQTQPISFLRTSDAFTAFSVILGTVCTYALNNYVFSLGPIKASSVTGMLSSLFLPGHLALSAFCGSFAGMARTTVIPNFWSSIVLGLVCAVIQAVFDKTKVLVGVGGRLGLIAQLSCTIQFIVSSFFYQQNPAAKLLGSYSDAVSILSRIPIASLFSMLGALFMSAWRVAFENINSDDQKFRGVYQRLSGSVAAVSATGLFFSLFPVTLAGPAFCGAFIAMSSSAKLDTYGALISASLFGGLSQAMLEGVLLGGWGGKLGTASLLAVLMHLAFSSMLPVKAKRL